MKILIINSNWNELQTYARFIGGDGYDVSLLATNLTQENEADVVDAIIAWCPDLILLCNADGLTTHQASVRLAQSVKKSLAGLRVIYGGAYPAYHWQEILKVCTVFDYVLTECEPHNVRALIRTIATCGPLMRVNAIAFRRGNKIISTAKRNPKIERISIPMTIPEPWRQVS